MMERLRESVNGIAVKIILGLIICSFLFAGVGGYITAGNVEPVALVGEREISTSQFEQAYQNERQQLQAQSGEIVTTLLNTPSYLNQFRRNVLDRMVNQLLLDEYADELNIQVSDEQIKQAIRDIPAFSSNGIFNNEQYLAALRRSGLTTNQFAQYIRQDLARDYLVKALQSSEFVLDNELTSYYKLQEQMRTVRTLTLPLIDFTAKTKITDEQKKAYYDSNSSQFLRPEQFKISYVELSAESIADMAEISVADAQAFYQDNLTSYGTAERRKVSHIMIEGDDDKAKQKAQALSAQLKSGANFAELAKVNSEDAFSAKQGGQLDWFDKGIMDQAFEDAAFELQNKNDVSEVVQSEFGFHIIQLDDVSLPDVKPFEEVREEILQQLKQQQAVEKFYEQSNLLAERAFEISDTLDDAASAISANVEQTDFVSLADLQGVLANPAVLQVLEEPEVRHDGLNSQSIEVGPEHIMVVRIDDVRPEMILPFAEVDAQVERILLRRNSENAAEALVNNVMTELKEGSDKALLASGYTFSEDNVLTRTSPERDVVALAFTMPIPKQGMSQYAFTRDSMGSYILVSLDAVEDPEGIDTNSQGPLAESILLTMVNADMNSVLEQLKASTDVTYALESILGNMEQ